MCWWGGAQTKRVLGVTSQGYKCDVRVVREQRGASAASAFQVGGLQVVEGKIFDTTDKTCASDTVSLSTHYDTQCI